jgi:hypothetical protein
MMALGLLPGWGRAQTDCMPPETMPFSENGPTQWPGACWRPFEHPNNPFLQEIPQPVECRPVHTNSDNIVKQLLHGQPPGIKKAPLWKAGELQGRLDGQSGEPTYYTSAQQSPPRYRIRCANDPYHREATCPQGVEIKLWPWALPENGVQRLTQFVPVSDPSEGTVFVPVSQWKSNDAHMTIIDIENQRAIDIWGFQSAPLPRSPKDDGTIPEVLVQVFNTRPLYSDGLYGYSENAATAAKFSNLQGRIRLEELEAGDIKHALFMYIYCVNDEVGGIKLGPVYPAHGKARQCAPELLANAPPTGSRFFYDRKPEDIDKLKIMPWKKVILKALSKYGAFVGDTAGSWGFEQESSYQYSSVPNGERRWYNFGATLVQNPHPSPDNPQEMIPSWAFFLGNEADPGERYYGKLDERQWDGSKSEFRLSADDKEIEFETYLKVLDPSATLLEPSCPESTGEADISK